MLPRKRLQNQLECTAYMKTDLTSAGALLRLPNRTQPIPIWGGGGSFPLPNSIRAHFSLFNSIRETSHCQTAFEKPPTAQTAFRKFPTARQRSRPFSHCPIAFETNQMPNSNSAFHHPSMIKTAWTSPSRPEAEATVGTCVARSIAHSVCAACNSLRTPTPSPDSTT